MQMIGANWEFEIVLGENFSYPITSEYDNHVDDSGGDPFHWGQKYIRAANESGVVASKIVEQLITDGR